MKTDLEVEVEVDLRPLGKVIIFRDRHSPIIYRFFLRLFDPDLRAVVAATLREAPDPGIPFNIHPCHHPHLYSIDIFIFDIFISDTLVS